MNEQDRLKVVLLLEVLKCLLRLYVIYKSKSHQWLEFSVLPNDILLNLEQRESDQQKEVRLKQAFNQQQQHESDSRNLSEGIVDMEGSISKFGSYGPHDEDTSNIPSSNGGLTIGKRSGKIMPTWDTRKVLILHNGKNKERLFSLMPNVNKYFLAGDILYVLRPCFYVLSLIKFGRESWKPWCISLVCDYISRNLCLKNAKGMGQVTKNEMLRRRNMLFYYLLRSPCFDELVKPFVDSFNYGVQYVPLFGGIISNIVDYMVVLQTYYSYTAAN